jgi:hypothetical protein
LPLPGIEPRSPNLQSYTIVNWVPRLPFMIPDRSLPCSLHDSKADDSSSHPDTLFKIDFNVNVLLASSFLNKILCLGVKSIKRIMIIYVVTNTETIPYVYDNRYMLYAFPSPHSKDGHKK